MREVGPENRLWYRRDFKVPAGWAGKRVLLNFGAVDWEASVWVNGHKIGEHRGGYDPFSFDITSALTDGRAAADHRRGLGSDRCGDPGPWQANTKTGIDLVLAGHRDLADGLARAGPRAGDRAGQDRARCRQGEGAADGRGDTRRGGQAGRDVAGPLPFARRQTRDAYPARGAREGGRAAPDKNSPAAGSGRPTRPGSISTKWNSKEEIRRRGYFGLRDISRGRDASGNQRLLLNGKPLFHYGPLDQGWWPDGLYTAPSR